MMGPAPGCPSAARFLGDRRKRHPRESRCAKYSRCIHCTPVPRALTGLTRYFPAGGGARCRGVVKRRRARACRRRPGTGVRIGADLGRGTAEPRRRADPTADCPIPRDAIHRAVRPGTAVLRLETPRSREGLSDGAWMAAHA